MCGQPIHLPLRKFELLDMMVRDTGYESEP
jgi:hypothetical protein